MQTDNGERGDWVDKVRRKERRQLKKVADERLTGAKQLWLYDPANLSDERYQAFEEILMENLKTGRAWLHKENFRGFWDCSGWWSAEGYFKRWYSSAIRSRLEPIKKVARSLRSHLEGLLNYTLYPITNAVTEGINAKIQQIKASARGFRNFRSYRTRILFHCGKLDLLPSLPLPVRTL